MWWSLAFQLIPAALNAIPKVEALFGPTKGNGPEKQETAMGLISEFVPELEDIFSVKPEYRAIVSAGISLVYEVLKVSGKLPAMTASAAASLPAASTATPAVEQPGS